MQCRMATLTRLLISLVALTSLAGCAGLAPAVVSDYCALYVPVVAPTSAAAIKALPSAVKRSIVSNDIKYKCLCTGWKNPICGEPQR